MVQPGQHVPVFNNSADPAMDAGAVLTSLSFYSGQKEFLPPQLTSEGARVDPDWLMRFLKDPSQLQPGEKPPAPTSSGAAPASTPASTPAAAKPATGNSNDQSAGRLVPQPGANRNGVRPYLQVHMPPFNFSPNELRVLGRVFMTGSSQNDQYSKE